MTVIGSRVVATGLSGLTTVRLAALTAGWLRNDRRDRTVVILRLVGVGAVLLVENVVALYIALTRMRMLYTSEPVVGDVELARWILELGAVAALTTVTLESGSGDESSLMERPPGSAERPRCSSSGHGSRRSRSLVAWATVPKS